LIAPLDGSIAYVDPFFALAYAVPPISATDPPTSSSVSAFAV
jgi:hypothetical protein